MLRCALGIIVNISYSNHYLESLILNKSDQDYYYKNTLDAIIQEYGDIITYVE